MSRARIYVSPSKGGWKTHTAGRTISTHRTQAAAIRSGAAAGKKSGDASLYIQGRGGQIRDERSYGSDPRRTKG